MTPLLLQNALKNRIEHVVQGIKLSSLESEEKEIQVFEQHLPTKTKSTSRNPDSTHYPCVIVYIDEGEQANVNVPEQVKALFIVGVYDEGSDNQGYKDALNIIEKIKQNLLKNPIIDERYELAYPFKWKYSDEDNGPYNFAWIEISFEIPDSLREDVEAMI